MRGIFRSSTLHTVLQVSGLRFIGTSHCCLAVDKGLLSKLRKQTGIPFINCKKALEKFDNDFDQAKQWLTEQAQKEGWARATKLQTRPMSQGLVAVLGDGKHASLLEVNCETDFVARNEKFLSMVASLIEECHGRLTTQTEQKINLTKEELECLETSDNSKLADIVALNVGNMGENMALRRAAYLRASDDTVLCSYVHPSSSNQKSRTNQTLLGKYGAIIELRPIKDSKPSEAVMSINDLGSHLCQHIVGMNPKGIGAEYVPGSAEAGDLSSSSGEESDSSSSSMEEETKGTNNGEEDYLLSQEFLLDTSVTVGELLHINRVQIKDFIRFACGEEIDSVKD